MLKIYLTDLAAYNKGFLLGEWITLPMDEDELSEAINKVLRGGEAICALEYGYEEHEEYFITDWEFEEVDLWEIGEYENITNLNKRIQELEHLDLFQLKVMQFLLSEGLVNDTEEAIEKLEDVIVYQNTTMEDLAYDLINECYEVDKLPSIIANHIDYDGVASDLLLEGRYYRIGDDIYEYCA